MENIFLAKRLYKDGYQFDGYEVTEHIDGYQVSSVVLNSCDVARLERHMSKIEYIVRKADEIPVPQRCQDSMMEKLYQSLAGQVIALEPTRFARLRELLTKHAALYAAISNADGYK